jgi:hypothetical protein
MFDITTISTTELTAAVTSVEFSGAVTAPSVMAGEPCD